jgi:hypothetical protein
MRALPYLVTWIGTETRRFYFAWGCSSQARKNHPPGRSQPASPGLDLGQELRLTAINAAQWRSGIKALEAHLRPDVAP